MARQLSVTYARASHRVSSHSTCFTLQLPLSIDSNLYTSDYLIAVKAAYSESSHAGLLSISQVRLSLFDCRKPFSSVGVKVLPLSMMHSTDFEAALMTIITYSLL